MALMRKGMAFQPRLDPDCQENGFPTLRVVVPLISL